MSDSLKFNVLEDGAMDDQPPTVWNGPHVGKRIADAFGTLQSLPVGMSRKSGLWPSYPYEFEDLLAQQEAEQRTPSRRPRVAPTLEQITHMEAALCWPGHYLAKFNPDLMLTVNGLALERSRGGDSTTAARRWHTIIADAQRWQRMHDQGCDLISRGLIRDRARVF